MIFLKKFEDALDYYEKALRIYGKNPNEHK
jgi:hypothetical protein